MVKVILISQKPLPYSEIGSWTMLYENYIKSDVSKIDFIICEIPDFRFINVLYGIVPNSLFKKVKQRLYKNPYEAYIDTFIALLKPEETYVVKLVDNFGLVKELYNYLKKYPHYRKQLYIQFFYHGYSPFYDDFQSRWFFEFVDEMVLLTHSSYIAHKNKYTNLPCLFSVLHNGIDISKFYETPLEEKVKLKQKFHNQNKTLFLWCSQDRPKKGLDFILKVWKSLGDKVKDCELLVVGAIREESVTGVKFLGRIPNDDLPKYYQAADVYLFPTLCQEGFGMSLIEALHCGCYCIASALGGVSEVLEYGKYGKLIEDPHFPNQWKDAILDYLNGNYEYDKLPKDKYSTSEWNKNMNRLIIDAKERIT